MTRPEKPTADTSTLKANARRSVILESWTEEDRPRGEVVKRFHHPTRLQALRDRSRARAEFELLSALSRRGLPVPRPLALERAERGWQVRMEWLPDTVSLAAILIGEAAWPVAPALLASALGKLLADLHAARVDHADLHPGNLLVGADGGLWAIDFHASRLRDRLDRQRVLRDLVALVARLRETTSPAFRNRVVSAWSRGAPRALRVLLEDRPALVRRVEGLARERRRADVFRSRKRWLRTSSLCLEARVPADAGGGTTWTRRGADPLPPWSLGAQRPWPALLARWFTAARLTEHGIPCAHPHVLLRAGARSLAVFDAPFALEPASARELSPPGLGDLLGALHDRGLAPARLAAEHLHVDGDGRPHLLPQVELLPFDAAGAGRAARLAGLDPDLAARAGSPDFAQAYADAFRGGPWERTAAAGGLAGG